MKRKSIKLIKISSALGAACIIRNLWVHFNKILLDISFAQSKGAVISLRSVINVFFFVFFSTRVDWFLEDLVTQSMTQQ